MLILRHLHVTAVFVNNDVQRRRGDIDQKFADRKDTMLAGCLQNFLIKDGQNVASTGCFRSSEKLVLLTDMLAVADHAVLKRKKHRSC